jgi:hypothetical protein
MTIVDPSIAHTIMGSAVLILVYGISLWRIVRRNRGDRFIESASLTVMVFVLMVAAKKIPNSPTWVFQFLAVLMYALAFLSAFFGLQQAYHALSRRSPTHQASERLERRDTLP